MSTEFVNGQPCWVDVSVADVATRDELMSRLGTLFGWTFDIGTEETGYYTMCMVDGVPVVALMAQPEGQGQWVTYLATDDITATAAKVTANGGQIFMGPMEVMTAGSMALGIDPTGAVFGLWQKNDFPGFPTDSPVGAPSWFDHQSTEPAKAVAFYKALFDLDEFPSDMGSVLGKGELQFASFSTPPGTTAAHWAPVILVQSLEAAELRALEAGASVVATGMEVPGGHIAILDIPAVANLTVFAADA